jgi:hypothetical protein
LSRTPAITVARRSQSLKTARSSAQEARLGQLAALEARLLEFHAVQLDVAALAVADPEPCRAAPPDAKARQPAALHLDLLQEGKLPVGVGEVAVLQPDRLQVKEPERLAGEGDAPEAAPDDAGAADARQQAAVELQVAVALRVRQPRGLGRYETSSSSISRSWLLRLRPRWRPKKAATRST